jgi:hypothetical protein
VSQPDNFSNVVVLLASEMSCLLNGDFTSRDLRRQESVVWWRQMRDTGRFYPCIPQENIDS